jgi:putative thiamine transport system permease protein
MFLQRQHFGAAPLVLLFLLPLGLSLLHVIPGFFDWTGFAALLQHPQFWGAVHLTLFTGLLSTVLALLFAVVIVMSAGKRLLGQSSVFLALPHLALAMGLVFLLAPTGLMARLLVGGAAPPDWQVVQDPVGLGLIVALVLKETPFLVWTMAFILQSDELRLRFQHEAIVARSLGHGPRSTFLKVLLPQILSRSLWPLIAVFSYGMTVVDMALVIGPTQPPTLAQLVWTDLNDGETATNLRGAAGTVFLSGAIAFMLAGLWGLHKALRPQMKKFITRPARIESETRYVGRLLWVLWWIVYAAIFAALLLQSFSQLWPYPQLLATSYTFKSWISIWYNLAPLLTSLVLGLATASVSLLAIVIWFETQPPQRDRFVLSAATVMLCLPAILVSLGQYRVLLQLGWTGTWMGLFSAHLLPVMAYVFVMLQGPYRGYDGRWHAVSDGLGVVRSNFLMRVKWPMLRAHMLSAFAVGFAVSIAQFVPAQLAAAGRFSTLPMEAVTLSSGGNRALISAYGLALMLLPLIGFGLATTGSRSRWRNA